MPCRSSRKSQLSTQTEDRVSSVLTPEMGQVQSGEVLEEVLQPPGLRSLSSSSTSRSKPTTFRLSFIPDLLGLARL